MTSTGPSAASCWPPCWWSWPLSRGQPSTWQAASWQPQTSPTPWPSSSLTVGGPRWPAWC